MKIIIKTNYEIYLKNYPSRNYKTLPTKKYD